MRYGDSLDQVVECVIAGKPKWKVEQEVRYCTVPDAIVPCVYADNAVHFTRSSDCSARRYSLCRFYHGKKK